MWIYGSSVYATLVAVVVPDAEFVVPWLKTNGIAGDFAEAAQSATLRDAILQDIVTIAKQEQIPGFKVPKDLIIEVRDVVLWRREGKRQDKERAKGDEEKRCK